MSQNINLSYQVPISESAFVNNEFIIQGTAINETTTSNNHKFIGEELSKAAQTLTGCPLLVDHENKVENIKGRVLMGMYSESGKRIDFKAKVMDKLCQEMIKDGRLNSVSVGAMVSDLEEEDGGVLVPRGITFKELSLVAVPADSGATFSIAMKEAYNASKPKYEVKAELEVKPVTEELTVQNPNVIEFSEKPVEMPLISPEQLNESVSPKTPENAEESVKEVQGSDDHKLKGGLKEMSEEATNKVEASDNSKVLMEKLEAMEKTIKEQAEKIASMSAPKQEKLVLVNEFEEKEADVKEGYKIIQGDGFFSYVADKY